MNGKEYHIPTVTIRIGLNGGVELDRNSTDTEQLEYGVELAQSLEADLEREAKRVLKGSEKDSEPDKDLSDHAAYTRLLSSIAAADHPGKPFNLGHRGEYMIIEEGRKEPKKGI